LNNFIKKYLTERLIFDYKFRLGPIIYSKSCTLKSLSGSTSGKAIITFNIDFSIFDLATL